MRARQISRDFSRITQQAADLRKELQSVTGLRFVRQVCALVVVKELHPASQVRLLLVGEEDLKAPHSLGEDVHAPVLVLANDLGYASAAPYRVDLSLLGQDDPELLLAAAPLLRFQAGTDHLLVAFLDDVEGQQLFRE